jgi:hypothetical protein
LRLNPDSETPSCGVCKDKVWHKGILKMERVKVDRFFSEHEKRQEEVRLKKLYDQ